MSTRYVSIKALQRPPRSASDGSAGYPTLLSDTDGISSQPVRPNVERLVQILGATTKTNQYGEHISARCWCAQPAAFSPDARALKLLLPEAPDQVADPEEWLFLDTETTGLSGGSGTYPFLVGFAGWDGGELKMERFFRGDNSEGPSLLIDLQKQFENRRVLFPF